jgi:hypothetical protein
MPINDKDSTPPGALETMAAEPAVSGCPVTSRVLE